MSSRCYFREQILLKHPYSLSTWNGWSELIEVLKMLEKLVFLLKENPTKYDFLSFSIIGTMQ